MPTQNLNNSTETLNNMTQKLNNKFHQNDHITPTGADTKVNKSLLHTTFLTLTFAPLMFLAACSDEPNSQPKSDSSTNTAATSSAVPVESIQLDLPTTPLEKQAFLGLVVPKVVEAAPCPFLSDETALATAKTSWVLKRRETSNERCYWSKNAGFSIKVTVEPLATAKPVRDRVYNLDSPPVLKNQPEPGNNAVVIYDTVWDKERPYAMAFEQDNKLVMIYVTGMSTDAERLTAAAMEVASKLSTAPTLNSQDENAGTFDMCRTWSESDIAAIIGAPVQTTMGSLDCKWETGTGENMKQIRVTIYSGKSYPWDNVLEQGASDVPGVGERGLMERKRKRSNMPGHVLLNALYGDMLVTTSVTDTIADHEAVALALSKNIDSRF